MRHSRSWGAASRSSDLSLDDMATAHTTLHIRVCVCVCAEQSAAGMGVGLSRDARAHKRCC